MKPNVARGKMSRLPDTMIGKGGIALHPNAPAPARESVPDRRPHTFLPKGIETAEQWGNLILSERNGGLSMDRMENE